MPSAAYAALAALGCIWMGIAWAMSLSRRARALRAWVRALAKMEAGLLYRTHTLEELLELAADGEENREVAAWLAACAKRMREEPMLSLCGAAEGAAMPELLPSDCAALSPLWSGLGTGDAEAQRGLLASVRTAMEQQVAEAVEKERKDRRLAATLGVVGGAAVFLFLL